MRIHFFATVTAAGAALASIPGSLAQTPTAAQQQAIRSSCVSDYKANCATVPTGGMDALVCLEQHESNLSPACKSAVEAVDHGSSGGGTTSSAASTTAASGETSTTAAAPKSATAPASGKPAMSLRQEMRLAARSCAHDYRVLCPNLPMGQGNVLFCLKVQADRLSTPCRNALLQAGEKL